MVPKIPAPYYTPCITPKAMNMMDFTPMIKLLYGTVDFKKGRMGEPNLIT